MDVNSSQLEMNSDASHFSPHFSQSLTECLVDNSEQLVLQNNSASETVIWDDWREAASGWQLVVPYPKYATRRHRPRHQKSDLASRKGLPRPQSDFNCLTEDSASPSGCYPWKDSVEPVTYSYLPNNGFYRNSKPGPTRLSKEVQLWLEAMQSSNSAKSMLARQLRKAAENRQKQESAASGAAAGSEAEPKVATTDTRNQEPVTSLRKRQSTNPGRTNRQKDKTSEVLQFAAKRLQSQAQTLNSTGDRTTYFAATLAENHSTCHSGMSRKSSELSLHGHFPLNTTDKRQLTDAYMPNTTRLAIQTKTSQRYEEDLFTFIPVCKQEVLRPLSKLIPKQKEIENNCDHEKRMPAYANPQGKMEQNLPADTAPSVVLSAATVFPTGEESGGIRTARSAIAKTNLRIEEMRNSPLRSTQARSFFAHKGSGLALLKNGVLRYTVTK